MAVQVPKDPNAQYGDLRKQVQELSGLQSYFTDDEQKKFDAFRKAVPLAKPKLNYKTAHRLLTNEPDQGVLEGFAMSHFPDLDPRDPLTAAYGGAEKRPKDLGQVAKDFAEIASARSQKTLLGADKKTVDAAIEDRRVDMQEKADRRNAIPVSPLGFGGATSQPTEKTISADTAKQAVLEDDRILRLFNLENQMSPAALRVSRTSAFLADYDTLGDVLAGLPADDLPLVVAAIQLSNPAEGNLAKYLLASSIETGGSIQRFADFQVEKAFFQGGTFPAFEVEGHLQKEFGRDLKLADGSPIFDGNNYASDEAREEVRKSLVKLAKIKEAPNFVQEGSRQKDVTDDLIARMPIELASVQKFHKRQDLERQVERALHPRRADDVNLAFDMAATTMELIPFTLGAATFGAIGGPIAGFSFGYVAQHDNIRARYIERGMTPAQADTFATAVTGPIAALEYAGASKVFSFGRGQLFLKGMERNYSRIAGNIIGRKILDGAEEVGTEVAQQIVEDAVLIYAREFMDIEGLTIEEMGEDIVDTAVQTMKGIVGMMAGPAGRDLAFTGIHKLTEGKVSFGNAGAYVDVEKAMTRWREEGRTIIEKGEITEDENGNAVVTVPEEFAGEELPLIPASVYEAYKAAGTEAEKAKVLEQAEFEDGPEVLRDRIEVFEIIETEMAKQVNLEFADLTQRTAADLSRDRTSILADRIQSQLDDGETVDSVLASLVQKYAQGKDINIVVVNSVEELLGREDVSQVDKDTWQAEFNRTGTFPQIEGFTSGNSAFIVKDNLNQTDSQGNPISTPGVAVAKFAHEVLGHLGVDAQGELRNDVLAEAATILNTGGFLTDFGQSLLNLNPEFYSKQFGDGKGGLDTAKVADEIIARIAETLIDGQTLAPAQRTMWDKIRDFTGKSLGIETAAEWTDRNMAALVSGLMRGDRVVGAVAQQQTRFSAAGARSEEMRVQAEVLTELSGGDEGTVMSLINNLSPEMREIITGFEQEQNRVPSAQEIIFVLGEHHGFDPHDAQRLLEDTFGINAVAETLARIQSQPSRLSLASRPDVTQATGADIGSGLVFRDFFGNFHKAQGSEWFFPHGEYEPAIELDASTEDFQQTRGKYMGNFDLHIATSIPGFSDIQAIVGDALVKTFGDGAQMLDIGASEGALIKTLAEKTDGKIQAIALDPNPEMKAVFDEKGQVQGATYKLEALGNPEQQGQHAWTDKTGDEINFFAPGDQKFDIVHEAMVFQFLSNKRGDQVALVKSMMAEDGIAIFEEKLGTDIEIYNANEDQKDFDWKSKYYTEEQIVRKRAEILEKGGDTIEGMTALQVTIPEMEQILASQFENFALFWQSGNFRGYVASDSAENLQKFVDNLADTSSEFGTETPQVYTESRFSVEESRSAQAQQELRRLNVPLRLDGQLQLTHWSPQQDLDVLDPSEFGTGPIEGKERRRAGQGFVNRVQFGIAGYKREIDSPFRYHAVVDPEVLYPILTDPLNFAADNRFVISTGGDGTQTLGAVDLNKMEEAIRREGYQGIIGTGNFGPVVSMFEKVTPDQMIEDDLGDYAPSEVDAQGNNIFLSNIKARNVGYITRQIFRDAGSPELGTEGRGVSYSIAQSPVDSLGFFSPVHAEIAAMEFNQIPPAQLAARVRKLPRQEEMADIGFYDWLDLQEGKISKTEVLDFIDQGGVVLNELVLGTTVEEEDAGSVLADYETAMDEVATDIQSSNLNPSGQVPPDVFDALETWVETEGEEGGGVIDAYMASLALDNVDVYLEQGADDRDVTETGETEHSTFQMEGDAQNYREFLLTLPPLGDTPTARETRTWYETGEYQKSFAKKNIPWTELSSEAQQEVFHALKAKRRVVDYTHPHWPGIQNPLVHFRTNDRIIDGVRTLFIEEVQSDWIQAGRKQGFEGEVPDPGAFKRSGTVELMAMKRALAVAVKEGYGAIAWTPALEQIKRWSDALQQEVQSIEWGGPLDNAAEIGRREAQLANDIALREKAFAEGDQIRQAQLDFATGQNRGLITRLRQEAVAPTITVLTTGDNDINLRYDPNSGLITSGEQGFIGQNLADVFGGQVAKQILGEESGKLEGSGLTIGGKGFKDIYDRMLPKIVAKYVKPMGGKVGVATIEEDQGTAIIDGPLAKAGEKITDSTEVWNVEITDQMADSIEKGQPRYSLERGGVPGEVLDVRLDADLWNNTSDTRYSFPPLFGVEEPPRIDRSSLNGKEMFIFASDHMRVGTYKGLDPSSGISIPMQGGPGYPFAEGNPGKTAWAVSDEAMATRIGSRTGATDGIGLITLFSRDNAMANPTFAKIYMAEAAAAINSGAISKTRFLTVANQLRVAAKKTTVFKKKMAYAKLWNRGWKSLADMDAALQAATFELRKSAMFEYNAEKKGTNKGAKIGRDNLIAEGFPSTAAILDLVADPALAELPVGTSIGAVQFTGTSGPAANIGVDPHDSYPIALHGNGIAMFNDPAHINELVDNSANRADPQLFRSATATFADVRGAASVGPANFIDPDAPRIVFDPQRDAATDFAVRLLNGEKVNKARAQTIIDRMYSGADATSALFTAHALKKQLQPEWDSVQGESVNEAYQMLGRAETSLNTATQGQDIIDDAKRRFQEQYLKGNKDKEIRTRIEAQRTAQAEKANALTRTELEDAGLWITDPIEQLDIKEETLQPREEGEEEGAGVDNTQPVSEAEIIEVTEIPLEVEEYLAEIKRLVLEKTGLLENHPDFMRAYRATLQQALRGSVRALTYSRTRESLTKAVDRLGDLVQLTSIDVRAAKILTKTFQSATYYDRNALVRELSKIVRKAVTGKKGKATTSPALAGKLDKATERFLRQINSTKFDKVPEDKETGEPTRGARKLMDVELDIIAERVKALEKELNDGLDTYYEKEHEQKTLTEKIIEIQDEIELLQRFGGLKFKTLSEIQEVFDTTSAQIADAMAAQIEKRELRNKQMSERAGLIIDAVNEGRGKLNRGKFQEWTDNLTAYELTIYGRLQDMIRFAQKGDPQTYKALWNADFVLGQEGEVDELWSLTKLSRDIDKATHAIRVRKHEAQQELLGAIQQIYGAATDFQAEGILHDLLKQNDDYRKYSKDDNPQPLSKAHLIRLVGYLEQEWYRSNAETDYGNGARMDDYPALRSELSTQDLQLLEWMKEYYRRQRPELSDKKKLITGLGFPTEQDENYLPESVKIYGKGLRGVHTSLQITPAIMTERRRHSHDINENLDIFSIFFDRTHQNAVFLEMAETSLDMAELFGRADIQEALSKIYGDKYVRRTYEHFYDVISQKPLTAQIEGTEKAVVNYGAIVMNFNLGPAFRQPSSGWAFGFDHGMWDVAKWNTQWLRSLGGKKDLFDAVHNEFLLDVLRSPQAAARFDSGMSFEVAAAFETHGASYWKRVFKKYGMKANKYIDMLTIAYVGSHVYRKYYEQLVAAGANEEAAKKTAMDWMWGEAERHQQSAFIQNQSDWQRRGGVSGKLLGMFTSTVQQFLAEQNRVFRRARATGEYAELAKYTMINHIFLPLAYKMLDSLFWTMFGRPPDEDEWKEYLAAMVLGPLAGKFVLGAFMSTAIDTAIQGRYPAFKDNLVPAAGIGKIVGDITLLAWNTDDPEKMADLILDATGGLFPPVRLMREIYDNYLGDD